MGWFQDLLDQTLASLSWLPDPIVVMLLAFSPIGEVRVSVPVAIFGFKMGWGQAAVWSLFGNLFVAPVAFWLYPRIEALIRRWHRTEALLDRIYARTRGKQGKSVEKWQEAAIALFIAIPIPGSGAWSGVLVAHIFGLPWQKTWRYFYAGVAAATALVTVLVTTGNFVFFSS